MEDFIRVTTINDYARLHAVRMAVRENVLSNPGRITYEDYRRYLHEIGRGWVYVMEGEIVGLATHNVWGLFVHPDFEGRGIGKALQGVMLDWYFGQTDVPIWLSTGLGTRAEVFYGLTGWRRAGLMEDGKEARFELTKEEWEALG